MKKRHQPILEPVKTQNKSKRFTAGLLVGTIAGSALGLLATRKMDQLTEDGRLAEADELMKRTAKRTHRIGDTARYTAEAVARKVGKGFHSIKKEVSQGANDIKKTF